MPAPAFSIDAAAPWVQAHNQEVREVWAAFKADRPVRVPVIFTGARSIYADEHDVDYRTFYQDADEMFRLQLQTLKRQRELPLGDVELGELPKEWTVWVDLHPVLQASCFGCPVAFRPDAVPAHSGLNLSKVQCQALTMPDVFESGLLPRFHAFRQRMDKLCAEGLEFMGRPVVRGKPLLPANNGVFSLALDVRGAGIMSDMYDDPAFVHEFLSRLAHWQIEVHRGWLRRDGLSLPLDDPKTPKGAIEPTDHGIDMLSAEFYAQFLAALIHKLNAEFSKPVPRNCRLHHCGRGTHLFRTIHQHFGFGEIHGLTYPLNDIAKVRRDMGHDIWIVAVLSDGVITAGPAAIERAVRELLTAEVKGRGRLSLWVPGEVRGIPEENYRTLYRAVKEYGRY